MKTSCTLTEVHLFVSLENQKESLGYCRLRVSVVSPALLSDDHLGLVPVELEPQRPVAEVDLGPDPGAGGGQTHVAESGTWAGVGRVDAAGALPELVSRAEVTAAGCRWGKPSGRQHGAQVERWGVPTGAGRGVNRPTGGIRDERAGIGRLWALFGNCWRDVVTISTHPVLRVPAASSRIIPIYSWRLAPLLCCSFRRGESALSFTAEHGCFSRLYSVWSQRLIAFVDTSLLQGFFFLLKSHWNYLISGVFCWKTSCVCIHWSLNPWDRNRWGLRKSRIHITSLGYVTLERPNKSVLLAKQ